MKKEFNFEYGGKQITLETGRLARQADASVLVSSGGTQVLVSVCSAHEVNDGQDFFPLLVDYKEKFYAGGKFLGGFMKREARPGNHEILLMRMIDRPLRPLFPQGYMFETVVTAQVLSYDPSTDPQVLAGLGTAAALEISDIPFDGPLGFCKVGKFNGELRLNPSHSEWKDSELELVVAASEGAILMVEGEANELSEADMLEALNFAHDQIKNFCQVLNKMRAEVGKTKRVFTSAQANKKTMEQVTASFTNDARACLSINDKLERQAAIRVIEGKVTEDMKANFADYGLAENAKFSNEARKAVDDLLYNMMRADILNEKKRIGGRSLTQVRQIATETNVLDRVHGSSLFTRGETQVLAAVTLGGKEGEQMYDRLEGLGYERFYLHYSFMPFSVGEARGYRGVGRREIGHGNLAERSVLKLLPNAEECPYTIRVACEVLESNGSSSMGSVCSASMALMDAGIALKAPVAGIAMGLVKDGDKYQILTDILGDEDHLGDMDFKVAGTEKGITGIQMDIKIQGITKQIFEEAMAQAKEGRLHILGEMAKTISTARKEYKDGVPLMRSFPIKADQIGGLIGPGGKNIKALQEQNNVKIEVTEDGMVKVLGSDPKVLEFVQNTVELQLNGPALGSEYAATVVTIKEYGAFVDMIPGVSGLVHVSELSDDRVNDVNDYLSVGDIVHVKVLDVDRFGKIKLSAKAVKPLVAKAK